jgi:hypothetical protein
MSKKLQIMAALAGALVLGSMTVTTPAHAWTGNRTWVTPNGGIAHWHGRGGLRNYRGAVTYIAPNGKVYRRVTKLHNGPFRWSASRRWAGPRGSFGVRVGGWK